MDFSNLIAFVDHQTLGNDDKEQLELEVTNNIRHLGHNQGIKSSPFADFIVYDSDVSDEDDDDTEEEFPEAYTKNRVQLCFEQNIFEQSPKEYDEAPVGHNPLMLPTFTNICFVPEDEPPVRSLIKRVQDLDLSDYTDKDSINLEEY